MKKIIKRLIFLLLCVVPMFIFSACSNTSEEKGDESTNIEPTVREQINIEKYFQIDLKPNKQKEFSVISELSGFFTLEHTVPNGEISYYLYKADGDRGEILSVGEYTFIEKQEKYYLDVVNDGLADAIGTMHLTLQMINKNEPIDISLKGKHYIAFQYKCGDIDEILDLTCSDSNIVVKNVKKSHTDLDQHLDIDSQSVSLKFEYHCTYIIELFNQSNGMSESKFTIKELNKLPTNVTPTKKEQFYYYEADKQGYYNFSLSYNKASIGVTILNEELEGVPHSDSFGVGFKTIRVFLNAKQKIYFGIYDALNVGENIDISINFEQ